MPPRICTECEKESLLRAVKCEQYGMVFSYASLPGDTQEDHGSASKIVSSKCKSKLAKKSGCMVQC